MQESGAMAKCGNYSVGLIYSSYLDPNMTTSGAYCLKLNSTYCGFSTEALSFISLFAVFIYVIRVGHAIFSNTVPMVREPVLL